MTAQLSLTVENRVEELARIVAAVEDLAEQENWPPDFLFKINLVIEEFGINIMNYGYDGGQHNFQLQLTSEADTVTIDFIDDGKPFNPLEDNPEADTDTNVDDRPIGGLGLFLIKEMTEDFSYRREAAKNHSTMVMRKSE